MENSFQTIFKVVKFNDKWKSIVERGIVPLDYLKERLNDSPNNQHKFSVS